MYLCICLSVCLSIYVCMHLSIYPSIPILKPHHMAQCLAKIASKPCKNDIVHVIVLPCFFLWFPWFPVVSCLFFSQSFGIQMALLCWGVGLYMPKTSSGGQILGFKISKSKVREEKLRQKKADRRKKKKLGNMKTPTLLSLLANLTINLGKLRFLTKNAHKLRSSPHTLMYIIYIYICCRAIFWSNVCPFLC